MPRFETSTVIQAPPSQVFATVSDLRGAPERISTIVRLAVLTEGPVGRGTRFRETRVVFGREHTEEMEVTEFVPGERYVVECESCGCKYRSEIRVTGEGAGSRLGMSFDARPLTRMAKLMGTVTGPLMAKACRKALEKELGEIKASIEGSSAGARPGSRAEAAGSATG